MLNGNGVLYALPGKRQNTSAGRDAKGMGKNASTRIKRTLTALLLMFVLSFSAVFAGTEGTDGGTRTGTVEAAAAAEEVGSVAEEPDYEPTASIIKKGRYYYYQYPNGKIRKKAGFVTVDDEIYYVRRGGKIRTDAAFKVNKKRYRANECGVIQTGVYRWRGKYFYSNSKGQWRKKEGFVRWNDNRYYIKKGGTVLTNDGFAVENEVYCADRKGRVTDIELGGDGSPIIKVAKKQVGIMTGKKYWEWYYKTKFKDTDRTPWCGAFVAWCYHKAGVYKKISKAKRFGPLGYVPTYSRFANKYGKWISKVEKAKGGDIIVFGLNMHVGLVEGVYEDYVVTIEGNAGPTAAWGCGKPGAVVRKIYRCNKKTIKGVIRP